MTEYTIETLTSEDGKLRARIVLDEHPSEPYNDGGSPIIQLSTRGWYNDSAEQVTDITSYVLHDRIIEAAAMWARNESETFERYCRIFHGVTKIEKYDSRGWGGDCVYITLDPADWRELVGAPEGSLDMEEWRAYCEGDVYGIVVEKCITWRPVDDEDGDNTMDTWEDVHSCWGFYGLTDYTRERAREMMDET